jgi:hypothetical protein
VLSVPVRICSAVAAAAFAVLLLAPGAHASGLTASCDGQELERPFLPWADPAQYVLAPDGALDRGADGWDLANAGVVADNEPFEVRGPAEPAALHIGPGGSATSPAMCVTLAHPTLRFFARNAGVTGGTLTVEVLFVDPLGRVQSLPIGLVSGTGRWSPTVQMPIVANLLALLPGGQTPVAFRFTPAGEGSEWTIDDVYVDPYCKG